MKSKTLKSENSLSPEKLPPQGTDVGMRCIAYLLSLLMIFNPVAPSFAAIMSDTIIEQDFTTQPQFQPVSSSDYQYKTPAFIEYAVPNASSIKPFYDQVFDDYKDRLEEPTYVPILMGGITTIIPIYEKFKYIGTPAVQARYIRTQINALLGRTILTEFDNNESEQLNSLYENALQFLIDNPERMFGERLGFQQNDSDYADNMIWPERRIIHGQEVLVPIVYLTAETVRDQKVTSYTTEFKGTVNVDALTVHNASIKTQRSTFINVANNISTYNASISGDDRLQIVAGGAFDNVSSIVESKGDLVVRGKSIHNETIVYRYDTEQSQGGLFGTIAEFKSENGNLVLRSDSDITLLGSQVNAPQGQLQLAADGSIYIGPQKIFSSSETRYGSGTRSNSSVSFLQSGLSAKDTISLIAQGNITIDAAEIVSDQGHIELLAGMGITVIDGLEEYRSQAKGKFGSRSIEESVYQTVAIRSLLDAGKDLRLSSEFGDITLKAADIRTNGTTSVDAKNGKLNMLITKETDHYSYASQKKGLFTVETENRGRNIENVVSTTIVGGFEASALNGVNVEFEGDPELDFAQQVDTLAQMPGLEWMNAVRHGNQFSDVNWQAVSEAYDTWNKSTKSLSPAAVAVLSIAVGIATQGLATGWTEAIVGKAASATMQAAVKAGLTTLVSQASIALANGAVNGDIGGALESLATTDTLKSVAIAMVTAGALEAIDEQFFNAAKGNKNSFLFNEFTDDLGEVSYKLSLQGQAVQALSHSAAQAGIDALYSGQDFDESFTNNLIQQGVDMLGRHMANKIKGAFEPSNPTSVQTALKYISHAGAGCILGTISSSTSSSTNAEAGCASGAGGAVIGELISDVHKSTVQAKDDVKAIEDFLKKHNLTDPSQLTQDQIELAISEISITSTVDDLHELRKRGVNLARLGAAVGAFVAGAGPDAINISADTGQNAAENNAWFLIPIGIALLKGIDLALTAKEYYDLANDLDAAGDDVEKKKEILTEFAKQQGLDTIEGALLEFALKKAVPGATTVQKLIEFLREKNLLPEKLIKKITNGLKKEDVPGTPKLIQIRSAEAVNEAMIAAGNKPAWLKGTRVNTEIVPSGTQYQMVVSEGQAKALIRGEPAFGGFATLENIPSQAFARDKLVILEEFKPDVSYVITVETTAAQKLNSGFTGPLGNYSGGAQQVEFLDQRSLKMIDQPKPLPRE